MSKVCPPYTVGGRLNMEELVSWKARGRQSTVLTLQLLQPFSLLGVTLSSSPFLAQFANETSNM